MPCKIGLATSLIYSLKFLRGEKYWQFHHLVLLVKNLFLKFFCPVLMTIGHMVTFTALAKISNIPAIQRYLGLA